MLEHLKTSVSFISSDDVLVLYKPNHKGECDHETMFKEYSQASNEKQHKREPEVFHSLDFHDFLLYLPLP